MEFWNRVRVGMKRDTMVAKVPKMQIKKEEETDNQEDL